jgi:hypothetical protein
MRINQEDISNFIAEKVFKDIEEAYDWIETELNNGAQIYYYDS